MLTYNNRLCMNVLEIARELGVSKPMAYMLVNRADFPSFRIGKRILVPRDALETWLKSVSGMSI